MTWRVAVQKQLLGELAGSPAPDMSTKLKLMGVVRGEYWRCARQDTGQPRPYQFSDERKQVYKKLDCNRSVASTARPA